MTHVYQKPYNQIYIYLLRLNSNSFYFSQTSVWYDIHFISFEKNKAKVEVCVCMSETAWL